MKRSRWIPFGLWPANWGLEGQRRDQAEAHYYLEGEALERRLLALEHPEGSREFAMGQKLLDLNYNRITQCEYDYAVLELQRDIPETNYAQRLLELDFHYERIEPLAYRKQLAALRGDSWFEVVNAEFLHREDLGGAFNFELDWNEAFVEQLIAAGYVGASDTEIVDQWFNTMCAQMFSEPLDEVPEEPTVPGAKTTVTRLQNGTSEYS